MNTLVSNNKELSKFNSGKNEVRVTYRPYLSDWLPHVAQTQLFSTMVLSFASMITAGVITQHEGVVFLAGLSTFALSVIVGYPFAALKDINDRLETENLSDKEIKPTSVFKRKISLGERIVDKAPKPSEIQTNDIYGDDTGYSDFDPKTYKFSYRSKASIVWGVKGLEIRQVLTPTDGHLWDNSLESLTEIYAKKAK